MATVDNARTNTGAKLRVVRAAGVEVRYDPDADALTVRLAEGQRYFTADLDEDRFLHYSRDGIILAVEVLGVSGGVDLEGLPCPEAIEAVLQQMAIPINRGSASS